MKREKNHFQKVFISCIFIQRKLVQFFSLQVKLARKTGGKIGAKKLPPTFSHARCRQKTSFSLFLSLSLLLLFYFLLLSNNVRPTGDLPRSDSKCVKRIQHIMNTHTCLTFFFFLFISNSYITNGRTFSPSLILNLHIIYVL